MKKRTIIAYVSLIIFVLITILILTNNISSFDNYIYKIISNMRCDFLDSFMKLITSIGNTIPVLIILLIIMINLNYKNRTILGTSMIITLIINQLIKYSIRRPRPPIEERLISQGGYSFPSGHSMMSMCLYGVIIYLVSQNIKDKKIRHLVISILVLLVLLIGLSRIYLRVHYPSDVLAGFLLTIFILISNITFINNLFRGNNNEDVHK
jgi:undecaprenyl-diphosphatase